MELLLKHGAYVNDKDKVVFFGLWIFFFFVCRNINCYSHIFLIFRKDKQTPLLLASKHNHEIVKLLLEKGANIHAKNKVVIFESYFPPVFLIFRYLSNLLIINSLKKG